MSGASFITWAAKEGNNSGSPNKLALLQVSHRQSTVRPPNIQQCMLIPLIFQLLKYSSTGPLSLNTENMASLRTKAALKCVILACFPSVCIFPSHPHNSIQGGPGAGSLQPIVKGHILPSAAAAVTGQICGAIFLHSPSPQQYLPSYSPYLDVYTVPSWIPLPGPSTLVQYVIEKKQGCSCL